MAAAVYQKVFKTKLCYNQTCLFTLYPCFQSDFISIVTFWLSRKSTARVSRLPYLNHKICELCLLPLLPLYLLFLFTPSVGCIALPRVYLFPPFFARFQRDRKPISFCGLSISAQRGWVVLPLLPEMLYVCLQSASTFLIRFSVLKFYFQFLWGWVQLTLVSLQNGAALRIVDCVARLPFLL